MGWFSLLLFCGGMDSRRSMCAHVRLRRLGFGHLIAPPLLGWEQVAVAVLIDGPSLFLD